MFEMLCGLAFLTSPNFLPATQLQVEVRICKGDPLGSRDAGNVRYLLESCAITQSGRGVQFRAGGEVPFMTSATKVSYAFFGTEIEVVPLSYPNGMAWAEVNVRHLPKPASKTAPASEQTSRTIYRAKHGETFKYRIAANDASDQVWVEVTIRAASATK